MISINLFSLGGLSLALPPWSKNKTPQQPPGLPPAFEVDLNNLDLSLSYSSDPKEIVASQLSDEHDGSPIYVRNTPI
jgi:hypothetical protein